MSFPRWGNRRELGNQQNEEATPSLLAGNTKKRNRPCCLTTRRKKHCPCSLTTRTRDLSRFADNTKDSADPHSYHTQPFLFLYGLS
eukprot:gene10956-biopygen8997